MMMLKFDEERTKVEVVVMKFFKDNIAPLPL
jgi:hypothetical protein